MRRRVVMICTLVLAFTGCGGGDSVFGSPTGAPDATLNPSTTRPAATTEAEPTTLPPDTLYAAVVDMKDAVEAAGYPCDSWRVSDDLPADAVAQAHCTSDVLLTIYPDAAAAQSAADETATLLADEYGLASVFLVGANWTVNCSDDEALGALLRDALGGELQVTTP